MTATGSSPVSGPHSSTAASPSPAAPALDASALERELHDQIEGEVRFDDLSRALYATDASVYQIIPAGVVIPKSRHDVCRTLEACRRHGCSITARGGGTSQAGQAIGPGLQLDFSKYLRRLLVLNPGERWVEVEPGMVLDELNATLKPYGLQLPLDISTSDRATIGGMISNNSSGTRSVIYGKTLDYVQELTAVLADGSVVRFGPLSAAEVESKCAQADLEGNCYRTVRRLALEHSSEIGRRFPKILRRVGGYNLDEFTEPAISASGAFNLSRLIVGSEGTLALVLSAKLRLVPLPAARALAVVHFDSLLEALAATPAILEHRPSAVELLDRFILDCTRGRPVYEPLRGFIAGDPAAVLIVEFFAASANELPERLDRLEADLQSRRLGYSFHRAIPAAEQSRIWKLRRAALGLSMSERGDAKAISFVEDTAVTPERLRDYIERFERILAAHHTRAGFYAHASVGLLHVRPVVDLKTPDGVNTFRRIADEIADLVLEFGGALSGEHGDGLVRSPFQERMYGSELYRAFCEIKRAFDPAGILNPGKIVHAAAITQNLRFGSGYTTPDPPTALDFSDFSGLGRAAEQCSGVGECRKTLTGTMCPSYMATRDENDSTRGRANALRLAMSHPGGLSLSDSDLHQVLDLCLECRACAAECPTGVDMARMKSEFLHRLHKTHGIPRRARLLAHPARLARWGCRLAPVSNWVMQSRPARWAGEKFLGITRHRALPRFAPQTFDQWWQVREAGVTGVRQAADAGEPPALRRSSRAACTTTAVILFRDTFLNYFEPEIGIAAVEVIEAAGHAVDVVPHGCCGRPLISQGLLDEAREQAAANVEQLAGPVAAGANIVFCEPSCLSAMREDAPLLLRGNMREQAERVAESCVLFEEWLEQEQVGGRLELSWRAAPARILLHGHCHQKSMGLLPPAIALLSRIPNCTVIDSDAGCCGMAGSFGYAREHYTISRTIAEQRLIPAIAGLPEDTVIVASGTSCRAQIAHFTAARAVHPAVLLRSLFEV